MSGAASGREAGHTAPLPAHGAPVARQPGQREWTNSATPSKQPQPHRQQSWLRFGEQSGHVSGRNGVQISLQQQQQQMQTTSREQGTLRGNKDAHFAVSKAQRDVTERSRKALDHTKPKYSRIDALARGSLSATVHRQQQPASQKLSGEHGPLMSSPDSATVRPAQAPQDVSQGPQHAPDIRRCMRNPAASLRNSGFRRVSCRRPDLHLGRSLQRIQCSPTCRILRRSGTATLAGRTPPTACQRALPLPRPRPVRGSRSRNRRARSRRKRGGAPGVAPDGRLWVRPTLSCCR